MRFLADERCDFITVRALREAGHDVLFVSEIAPRAEDPEVIEPALKEKRILLTEDKDFGQLSSPKAQNPQKDKAHAGVQGTTAGEQTSPRKDQTPAPCGTGIKLIRWKPSGWKIEREEI